MKDRIEFIKNLFADKNYVDKIYFNDLISGELTIPDNPEGETVLSILRVKSEDMYGKYSGNKRIEISFEDETGKKLNQIYFLKDSKNNNLAKFFFDVLGKVPENQFSIKDLEGKKIIATISHYYSEQGIGYANIAFCRPIK